MFYDMYLIIEENKIVKRLDGTIARAIRKTIDEENNVRVREMIYNQLLAFNSFVFEEDILISDKQYDEYYEKHLNRLMEALDYIYTNNRRGSFYSKFSKNYWGATQEFILALWREMPNDKSTLENEASFMKVFEDLFNTTVKVIPAICEKKLYDFENLYRASTHEVFNSYNYIMPDPLYCKDNRWNDDGVAYLYLSYDNEDRDYKNIKLGQKTCFEEKRLKDDAEVAVCKFRHINGNVRILDLSYEDIDYEDIMRSLKEPDKNWTNQILSKIQENPKLKRKLDLYKKRNRPDLFKRELEKWEKQQGIDEDLNKYVHSQIAHMMLGNICDAIFYAVDKETDPSLEAYIPFRKFSKYLISQGFAGVAYRSTRMQKVGLSGKCLTLFNKNDATYIIGEMEVYKYKDGSYSLMKKY